MKFNDKKKILLLHLSENERDDVGGLPVRRVEEMRQSHGGERRESIGTVEGVVHPFTAPPPGRDYIRRGRRESDIRNRSPQCVDL